MTAVSEKEYKNIIVWENVVKFLILHILVLMSIFKIPYASRWTLLFTILTAYIGALGITAGAHRLWAHKSYKVTRPLKIFLIFGNLIAVQNSIYVWVRDHRTHHKFSETDADPHNSRRGFFFAHMGWLLVRKHPEVLKKGSKIDMSDLESDSDLMLQHKFYIPLSVFIGFILPTAIPVMVWQESIWIAYSLAVFRYVITLHSTWLVNSAAHLWGEHPYDINISPAENKLVSLLAIGEGFHNYHHTFPQDYSVSEWRYSLNFTTFWIDLMAFFHLAYDRKSVAKESVQMRINRTGPGTQKIAPRFSND